MPTRVRTHPEPLVGRPGSPDITASASFYSSLFGWDVKDQGEESGHYHMMELGVPRWRAMALMAEGQPPPG